MRAAIAVLFSLLLLSAGASAAEPAQQGTYNRLELWSAASLDFDLKKKFEIGVTQNLRITPDPLRVWELLTDVGLTKDVSKALRFGVGLRGGARDFVPGRLEPRFRAHVDARLKGDLGRVRLSLRERYQYRIPTWVRSGAHTIRSKGQIEVKVHDDADIFVAVEPYVRPAASPLERLRVEGGVKVDLPDKMDLEVLYRLEEPIADPEGDPRSHIVAVALKKRLKIRREKNGR